MRFVPVEKLKPGMVLGRNIKSTLDSTLLRNGVELTDKFISHLVVRGYLGAYILDDISEGIVIPETIPQSLFNEGVEAVLAHLLLPVELQLAHEVLLLGKHRDNL